MKVFWGITLYLTLLGQCGLAVAQGNTDQQEKVDVLYRDVAGIDGWTLLGALLGLNIPNPLHGGIFYQYGGCGPTNCDPSNKANSFLIEMLKQPNGIATYNKQGFISSTTYHGAFSYPVPLKFGDRRLIVQTMQGMENRTPTGIAYSTAVPVPEYLDWTHAGVTLQLGNITNLRSDAAVEFAYTSSGLPIVRTAVGQTIVTSPDVFASWAAARTINIPYHGTFIIPGELIPLFQTKSLVPAIAVNPVANVYDANGDNIFSGGASSMTNISVNVYDAGSGPGGLELWQGTIVPGGTPYACTYSGSNISNQWHTYTSTTDVWTGFGCNGNLSSLPDGQYSIRAIDQAGNWGEDFSVVTFRIDTQSPGPPELLKRADLPFSGDQVTNDFCPVLRSTGTPSGVCRLWWSAGASTATFRLGTTTAVYAGSFCGMSSGTYAACAENCAGKRTCKDVTVSSAALHLTVTGSGPGWSDSGAAPTDIGEMNSQEAGVIGGVNAPDCETFVLTAGGKSTKCGISCGCTISFGPPPPSMSWQIANVSQSTYSMQTIAIQGGFFSGNKVTIIWNGAPHPDVLYPGQSLSGNLIFPEVNKTTYTFTLHSSTLSVSSPFAGVTLTTSAVTAAQESARLRQVLRLSGASTYQVFASSGEGVFASTMTLDFQYTDAIADTTTLRLYRFEGASWSSAAVAGQSASRNGSVVQVVGTSSRTATFAAFFSGSDSSAPVTAFSIQGSSYNFAGTLYVSTDSYAVLTATDPAVSGYASQVSTTYYRIDAASAAASFSVYSSSLPLSLGPHVLEYKSQDYAGNFETVKYSTFVVTAGTVFQGSSDGLVSGKFLAGFLDYGIQAEVQSRAENDYTLLLSSMDASPVMTVSNVGQVGVGLAPAQAAEAPLDIGSAASATGALGLRSGNTAGNSSAQIAFGYNGEASMRHLLRTEHSTATVGNRMDFLVWDPPAGSTTAVARLEVMSLQAIGSASGGAVHIRPVGYADVELEVSDGLTTGGGTIRRAAAGQASSREWKSDISYLPQKEETRALDDVMALKHVRFRYKRRGPDGRLVADPSAPLREGLIYEDAPKSIRSAGESISIDERVMNLELALKSRLRKLRELEARLKALKEAGR